MYVYVYVCAYVYVYAHRYRTECVYNIYIYTHIRCIHTCACFCILYGVTCTLGSGLIVLPGSFLYLVFPSVCIRPLYSSKQESKASYQGDRPEMDLEHRLQKLELKLSGAERFGMICSGLTP